MDSGIRHFATSRGCLLLAALTAAALLYEILLVEAFPEHPLLCSLLLLLFCFVCYVGFRLESRKGVYFFGRVLLLLFSITAGLVSLEFLYVGLVTGQYQLLRNKIT
jgi:hypothetical protein